MQSPESGKWLLIIDNASDERLSSSPEQRSRSIQSHLPEKEGCLVLLTSRHHDHAVSFAGEDVIEIQPMSNDEAFQFMGAALTRTISPSDVAIGRSLFDDLGGLPLAIALATAYLDVNQHQSFSEYLQLFRQSGVEATRRLNVGSTSNLRSRDFPHAITKTFYVSMSQIDRSNKDAAVLLNIIATLGHTRIPFSLFPRSTWTRSENRLWGAVGTLCSYGFLSRGNDGHLYDMHRLVHSAAGLWSQGRGTTARAIRVAIPHLEKTFPSINSQTRPFARECLPHAIHLLKAGDARDPPARHSLCMQVGQFLCLEGKSTAVALFVLFHCRSELGRIIGFRPSLTPAENAACCSEYLVLTIRVQDGTRKPSLGYRRFANGISRGACTRTSPSS